MTDQDRANSHRAVVILQELIDMGRVVPTGGWYLTVSRAFESLAELESRGIVPDGEQAAKLAVAIAMQLGAEFREPKPDTIN